MNTKDVYSQLLKLGFSSKRIGTLYLADAVVMLSDVTEKHFYLEQCLYLKLAKKYGKNVYTIKSNLLLACKIASERALASNKKAKARYTPKYTIEHLLSYNLGKEGKETTFLYSRKSRKWYN